MHHNFHNTTIKCVTNVNGEQEHSNATSRGDRRFNTPKPHESGWAQSFKALVKAKCFILKLL